MCSRAVLQLVEKAAHWTQHEAYQLLFLVKAKKTESVMIAIGPQTRPPDHRERRLWRPFKECETEKHHEARE